MNLPQFLTEVELYSSLHIRTLHRFTIRGSLGSFVNLKIKTLDLVKVELYFSLLKIWSHTAPVC